MPVETEADLAGLFDTDEFAEGAVYLGPSPGTLPAECTVIIDRGQGRETFRAGEHPAQTSERHLTVRAAELADVKRDGTFITDGNEVFRVTGLPKLDQTGKVWSVDLLLVD